MTSNNHLEPSRVENRKNEKFRSLDEMDQDVFFNIGRRIIDWIQATTGEDTCHHFGVREAEDDTEGVKSGKAALRSLLLVSRRFNSIWTPISIQNVTIWAYQLPSFLSLLLEHPKLASNVRSLNFIATNGRSTTDSVKTTVDLLAMRHPQMLEMNGEDWYDMIPRIVGKARSLIIELCTNLRELTFNSGTGFPFKSSDSTRLIFSERMTSIKTVRFAESRGDDALGESWTGRQALAVLIFLPALQSASMVFNFDFRDAQVINTHLSSLLKSGKAVSNIKKLALTIHEQWPMHRRQLFDYNPTFDIFLSIFKSLENVSLTFIEDPKMNSPMPQSVRESRRILCPTGDVIKGLSGSSATLKSLSLEGLNTGSYEETMESKDQRFRFFFWKLKKLEHLRIEGVFVNAVFSSEAGFYEGPDIRSLELSSNFSGWYGADSGGNAELFVTDQIKAKELPNTLELFRTPRRSIAAVNPIGEEQRASAEPDFQRTREAMLQQAEKSGIKVEFI